MEAVLRLTNRAVLAQIAESEADFFFRSVARETTQALRSWVKEKGYLGV